jgi:hypothetical protein
MDFIALGRACLAALVAELTGAPPPPVAFDAPHLVIRESTAPPRRR